MPKNKKAESSSSDSDEGPIDRHVPPVTKKSKTEGGTATATQKAAASGDGEPSWVLGGSKQATVRVFKGKAYVDVREMYEKNGQLLPGKKGIALNPIQWRKLIAVAEEITTAVTEAC